ncbi:retron St85 family RNA-directed DNA polymerase [Pseudomonas sp. NCCP-436]|uniref:retron St85 family RNA-directed DNA polymerase n=1 Tax=Pseudomonas sp. NCCP-436 TaxID=2842481 RepID=UPI001C80CBE5|nr:retron St85 family RNA-directed DNA polymerase [Pseudomonas sp. NCCP-436]GIZ13979.1 RNA-directed DNA polymerase [Pseudomonas sp. NCCP-436]
MSSYEFRQDVVEFFSVSEHDVFRLLQRAPHTYKRYEIDKKSGGKRLVAQPAKETKILQRYLMRVVFNDLPIHECATAYSSGSSVRKNAELHVVNPYISKFDFVDFFGSIKESDLILHFSRFLGGKVSEQSIKDIARVCCIQHKGRADHCLSIGAPSSPVLSNSIMYDFDEQVEAWCKERGITYSRYADDLTFSTSGKGVSAEIEPMIRGLLNDLPYPRLSLNDKKTLHLSKKVQRRVTGVILNNEGKLSLGRERKRKISSMIHRFSLGQLDEKDVFQLQGLLGFAEDVEPLFVSRMRGKYGIGVISALFQKRSEGRINKL